MTYKLEDDPNIASVLRLVTEDRFAQAKAIIMKGLSEDEYSRLHQLTMPVLRNKFKLRHKHVPGKILTPALALSVLEQAADREASR